MIPSWVAASPPGCLIRRRPRFRRRARPPCRGCRARSTEPRNAQTARASTPARARGRRRQRPAPWCPEGEGARREADGRGRRPNRGAPAVARGGGRQQQQRMGMRRQLRTAPAPRETGRTDSRNLHPLCCYPLLIRSASLRWQAAVIKPAICCVAPFRPRRAPPYACCEYGMGAHPLAAPGRAPAAAKGAAARAAWRRAGIDNIYDGCRTNNLGRIDSASFSCLVS